MKSLIICFTVLLCIFGANVHIAYAQQSQPEIFLIHYGGGTLPNVQPDSWMGLSVTNEFLTFYIPNKPIKCGSCSDGAIKHFFKKQLDHSHQYTVSSNAVKQIVLSQDKHHRIGTGVAISVISLGAGIPVMFTKSTKDYISVTWDEQGTRGAAEFQSDKNEYRGLLTTLSGVSGVNISAAVDTQGKK